MMLAGSHGGRHFGIYRRRLVVESREIPRTTPHEHTMGSALPAYVDQRLGGQHFDHALALAMPVEVHGIYPSHTPIAIKGARLVYQGLVFRPTKVFNRVRPHYYVVPSEDRRTPARLLVAVGPGRDYVRHYASLVSYYLRERGGDLAAVVRYPNAEASIAAWTHLTRLIFPGDRVLIGYVAEIVAHLVNSGATVVRRNTNAYYEAIRLQLSGGGFLCALGVRYSFWGDIAARLAAACQSRGAVEIIYVGKLGTLTTSHDVYRRLFVPCAYLFARDVGAPLTVIKSPPNGLLTSYPEWCTGTHLSVGTVLEEDQTLRGYAAQRRVKSIDNEISQIARALTVAETSTTRCAFSAVHIASDYLYGPNEEPIEGMFDLTNHRRQSARQAKSGLLREVASRLGDYLQQSDRGSR